MNQEIIYHCKESRIYLDKLSDLLKQVEMIIPIPVLISIGDQLASIQTLFQRIEQAARQ